MEFVMMKFVMIVCDIVVVVAMLHKKQQRSKVHVWDGLVCYDRVRDVLVGDDTIRDDSLTMS